MKKCPFCGADIEDSARFCLYCMQPLTEKEQVLLHAKKKPQRWLIVAAIVASALLAILLLPKMLNPSGENPTLSSTPSESFTDSTPAHTDPDTQPATEVATQPHAHNYCVENTDIKYQKEKATCVTPALYYYSCACGEMGSGVFSCGETENHTIVTDNGYPASCASAGLTDGTHCAVCNTVFLSQTEIPVVSHTYDNDRDENCNVCNYIRVLNCNHAKTVTLSAISPTCTTGGMTEGKKCSLCEEILTMQTALAPLGHTEVTDQAIMPTCTTDGKTEGKHCTTCHAILVAQITLDAKGHTEVIDQPIAATCTTGGKTEGKHCATCNTVLVAQTTVAAKGHTEVIDPAVAATCTTSGKTEGKHCSICNTILLTPSTIAAKGHAYSVQNVAAEYLKAEASCLSPATYYYSCACGEKGSETFSHGEIGAHNIVEIPGYPPGCTTPGLGDGRQCTICLDGYDPIEIPATGHTFPVGDSPSACQVCGEMGNITVQAPDIQLLQNNTFRIDSITYGVRPSWGDTWEITISINCTNISFSTAPLLIDVSLFFYDANGSWTGRSGLENVCNVQPNKSGTCVAQCTVPNSADVFKLVIS